MQKLEYWPIDRLIEYARNPRKNDHAVDRVASVIHEFGFRVPILAKSDGSVIEGHLRIKAARKLKLEEVPVIICDDMTETQIKAFRLSVNKVAELADWDEEMLGLELGELAELDFDMGLIGFSEEELAGLLAETTEGETDPDDVPEPPVDPVTVLGDVWILGKHRIACGDCTDPLVVEKAKGGHQIDHVVTDPPYGLGKKMSGGTWATKASHYADMHDWDKVADDEFLQVILAENVPSVIWGGNYFAVGPSRCWLVWNKPVFPTMSDAELAWTNLDKNTKRFDSNRVHQTDGQKLHPTQKPVELIKWCFEFVAGDHCFEPFSGSGTTIIAGEMTGRCVHAIELNPAYVDVAVKRWQDFAGKQAIHEASGKTFDEMKSAKP